MEEILASIRRIISEDDAPGGEAETVSALEAETVVAATPAPRPEPEEPAEDVLELTERVEPPKESVGDIDAYAKSEPEPVARPNPAKLEAVSVEEEDSLVSAPSALAAASAFSQLSAAIAMPAAGRTLEDLVGELLKPLLKDWLDQNLAQVVEAKVAQEVERIARSRVR